MMKDSHMRAALKKKLAAFYRDDPETLVVEELGLGDGIARIDLAVVNQTLHGFELKSDCDRLHRLPRQSETYSGIFDRMTLVVGGKLRTRAIEMIPKWWGVELAERKQNGAMRFHRIRAAGENESPLNALAIAKLLWRREALALLIELGQARGVISKSRERIHERLASVCDLEFLRFRVRDRLRNRAGWRFDEPQT